MPVNVDELKKLIEQCRKDVETVNRIWNEEKLSPRCKEASDAADASGEALANAIAKNVQELVEDLAKAGIELKSVELVEQYKTPYHSCWFRCGELMYGGRHIEVPGYPYRRNS